MSCGKQNRKVKDLLERANVQSPVTVEMRDGTAEITLEIVAAFGARIPAVAEKVQDYGCICVHVFSAEARSFYDLERLWADGKPLDLTGVLTQD